MKNQIIEYQVRIMNELAFLLNNMIIYGRYYQATMQIRKLDVLSEYIHGEIETIVNYIFDIYKYEDGVKFFDHFNTLNPQFGNWIEVFEFDFEDYRDKHIACYRAM